MNDSETQLNDLITVDSPRIVEYEYGAETPASIAVVEGICALEDIDPMEMPADGGFVLHDAIDPTALDSVLGDGTGDGDTVVSFEIQTENTYLVAVSDDGRIIVQYDRTASSERDPSR